jgi:hypothetical protein
MSRREIPQDEWIVCSDSEVIDIERLVQERGSDLIETGGVGLCIGIAIVIENAACLMHISGPSATVPTAIEPFFDSIRQFSTPDARRQAFPILFGCSPMRLGFRDEELAESADADWNWAKEKLSELGFAGINERRGDDEISSKTVLIDRLQGILILETHGDDKTSTEYFRWNSRKTTVVTD